jgi:ribosomal protein S18 acetylase RimI-like enzyme
MQVVLALPGDLPAWLRLTAEAESLFGPMLSDPAYLTGLRRRISAGKAFCVRQGDGPPGVELAGGLLFSAHPPRYRIGWLAVSIRNRRKGVGRLLVEYALACCETPCEVLVTTFAPEVAGGEAALAFYRSLGFQPGKIVADPFGCLNRQEYRLSL